MEEYAMNDRINTGVFVREIAKKTKVNIPVVKAVIDAMPEAISNHLVEGDVVSINGIGIFSTKTRAARTGRNPHTGEPMEIPEKQFPHFKVSETISKAVAKAGKEA